MDADDIAVSPSKILRDNAATLEEIKIDEVGCGALRRRVPNGNVPLYKVLSLGNRPVEKLFLSLKKLTLSAISFDNGFKDVPTVFSFYDLHYLALRNCLRVNEVLRVLSSTGSVPEVI